MRRLVLAAAAFLGLAAAARSECFGVNMFDEMPGERRESIIAAADAVPFARGNFWTASRAGRSITIVGTYHFDDPRHAPTLEALKPLIAESRVLLVEAGPQEEAALFRAMGRDPSLMFITEGPSLLERLPPETWARLRSALEERGIPGFLAAKFQPWYATMVLAVPACAMEMAAEQPEGLDGMLIAAAEAADVPVLALEPYDTLFTIFGGMSEAQEIDMVESSLAMEDRSSDYSVTLADAYFAGQSRLIWELMRAVSYELPGYTPEEVDAEMALLEEAMMVRRNRSWIPVIEANTQRGPVVAAFGALHLSGKDGVLNLLAQNGWTLAPLPLD